MNVSVRELKNRLSEHLARVRRGERLIVTLRGRPIAEVSPPRDEASLSSEERLRRMAEAGDVILPVRGHARDVDDDFVPVRLRPAKRGSSRTLSQTILDDRG